MTTLMLYKHKRQPILIVALSVVQPSVLVASCNYRALVKFYRRKCNVPDQPCLAVVATSLSPKILIGQGFCAC